MPPPVNGDTQNPIRNEDQNVNQCTAQLPYEV